MGLLNSDWHPARNTIDAQHQRLLDGALFSKGTAILLRLNAEDNG
jgi:hypothetical protein